MQSLLVAIKKDVFEQEAVVDESLLQEYVERSERKKQAKMRLS
ncbi:hypothetical protein V7201_23105 [Bacillus sp. JJ1122]